MKRYDNTHAISGLRAQPRNSNNELRQNTTDQQKKRVITNDVSSGRIDGDAEASAHWSRKYAAGWAPTV